MLMGTAASYGKVLSRVLASNKLCAAARGCGVGPQSVGKPILSSLRLIASTFGCHHALRNFLEDPDLVRGGRSYGKLGCPNV